jgi:two-component system, OmpR family, phosphate regulon sensor histidine kinase PhoR
MQTAINYSKRFAAWATALQEKYGSDLYFRTSVNIITLQAGFVAVCTLAFALALLTPERGWYIFGGVIIMALLSGVLLSRFTLGPARDTARYQKLFISNIAHELRTPLSTIKTSSEVALIDDTMPDDLKKTFTEIIEELNRVSEIINNLLSLNTLTRPERMQFTSVDIAPIAEVVMKRHQMLARERGIKMILRKEPGALVWGNSTALEQIMMNLIKNALSYTPADANGTVTITVRPDGRGMVLFGVSDTGIGMSQEDLFHIFEPFYRADTSRNRAVKPTGSGLGLTIVNEMVRAHHGRIHIESRRRKGTTVSVYFPRGGSAVKKEGDTERSETSVDFSTGAAVVR